ncbi:MAG TPA: CarD family transcriptional regulator, partial [Fimbriimonadaceae bacterium]|nr:CarD family transcriptional regulator [Fimbriimonadaceae bacterium]
MRIADWARRVALSPDLASPLTLGSSCEWQSVAPEARAFLLAAAYSLRPRKTLIVTANYERALAWHAKLGLCGVPLDLICDLPSGTSALFEDAAPEHIALSDRLGALRALTEDKPWIVTTTPQAVLERTLPREVLMDAFVDLKVGDELDADRLLRSLVQLGYEPQEPVRIPGQFSRRGGILDIFAAGRELPVRIELFGDEIESIRMFDPNSQRSVGHVHELKLAPSRETLYTAGDADYKTMLLDSLEREMSMLPDDAARVLEELVSGDAEALGSKQYFDRLDLYRPLLHPESGCAIDLLQDGDLLVLDEPLELDSIVSRAEEELGQALEGRRRRGEILASYVSDFMLPPEHLASHPLILSLSAMNALPEWLSLPERFDIGASSLEPYRGRSEHLAHTLHNWLKEDFTLLFSTDQPNRARSVLGQAEIFVRSAPTTDDGLTIEGPSPDRAARKTNKNPRSSRESADHLVTSSPHQPITNQPITPGGPYLADGNLGGGFILPAAKLAVITDAELFGVARLRLPQRRFMEGAPIATVLDLKAGDFVVHIHFGIGIFRGLVKRIEQGVEKEFLYVEYQAPDKLFVPADQLDRIQKYLNPGDAQPKLNRLTGGEWQRTLGKAREEAKEFARDLVKLYAMRRRVQRKPYPSDTPFQHEMEQTFPWVETPSQNAAIQDAKQDLQLQWPMDRLVCGDVGFGKTEVAIRAAFKVVQDSRQVAVLCPTTILSEQHYRNFSERLDPFGVR